MPEHGSGGKRVGRLEGRIAARPYWLLLGLVALAYFGVAKLGLSFASEHDVVSAVWPPSGVALAAVILLGYRAWPAIAVGALLANATGDSSLITAAGIATGNALAAVSGAYLLRRAHFDPSLQRIRDVVALAVLGAAASTSINAWIGVSSLWASGAVEPATYWSFWRVWWLGDLTGVLLVAPAILTLVRGGDRSASSRTLIEASALILALVGATMLALREAVSLAYPIFPLIVLAALRFRQPGAVVATLIASALAVASTAAGEGPFAGGPATDSDLLSAQLFVALAALTGLLVAATRSEWERAQEAVLRLEDGERTLTEAQALAHIGSWEWEIEPDQVRWSDELYRIFGRERDAFGSSYASYLACVHPDDRAKVERTITGAFETAVPFTLEHRIVRPGGEVRTLSSSGHLVCEAGGQPERMLGVAQDVTDQRLAEERFRGLLESAPDAMVIVNEAGEMVLVNSQTERMFGYRREELIGRSVETLMVERTREAHPANRHRFARDPHTRAMGSGLDLTALRKDGTEFPVEISLSPLATPDGMLVSSAIRDITERKQTQLQLEHQALHDPLTDLPNRVLFVDRLEQALARARRHDSKLAVYFCDIDDFKKVNDSLGHEAGDELLVALPPHLRGALREADTVGRFGGDEFVVLCEELASEADAIAIAKRITEAFARPLSLAGREHHLSVSVGIVLVGAGRATAAEILRDADVAMYRAKADGRGRFALFDAPMRARVIGRLDTEAELRRALDERRLRLHYQPIASLEDGAYVCAEALLRWEHPARGLLRPADFITVAEDSGLIVPIGAWVLAEACRAAAGWPRDAAGLPPRVSINLSPHQVADSEIVEVLARNLAETGIDPSVIELEITETVLMDGAERSMRTLRELSRMGVRLVLDDFGTGYSSLSRLKHFPIDALKIDRDFIDGLGTDAEDMAIVTAMLSMARALDLDVVAEGVETEVQLEWLRERGCRYAQGYLLSRPLAVTALEQLAPWRPSGQGAAAKLAGTPTG